MNTLSLINYQKEIFSPLDQFELRDLISLDAPILGNLHFSITNIGFYLIIGSILIFSLNVLSTNFNKLISNN
jgi:F-type H+-transporting ATPase subunit a